jgi:uridine kinase
MLRSQMLDKLSEHILGNRSDNPLLVAIDGIDTAGKSKLAKELRFPLRKTKREIIHISLDDFHQPRDFRYRRGKLSAEGYFYDSFNYEIFIRDVMMPLSEGGSRQYRKTYFDHRKNQTTNEDFLTASEDAIVLIDGVFLLRKELFAYWDLKIFVNIRFETCMERALERDLFNLGGVQAVRELYSQRYIPGQQIYLETSHPMQRADIVLHNDNFNNPDLQFQKAVAA